MTTWDWQSTSEEGKGGQSCGTEPLTCGVWCYLQVGSVRIELNCKTPAVVPENCLVWRRPPHIWCHKCYECVSRLREQRTHTGVCSPLQLFRPFLVQKLYLSGSEQKGKFISSHNTKPRSRSGFRHRWIQHPNKRTGGVSTFFSVGHYSQEDCPAWGEVGHP